MPRGIKITGFRERTKYFLVYGGRESKRKSSVPTTPQTTSSNTSLRIPSDHWFVANAALSPSLSQRTKKDRIKEEQPVEGPLTSDEILELKVLDPAMGSGHSWWRYRISRPRLWRSLIREGKDEDGIVTDEESTRYKRIVAERCIYGVDINPMAVEFGEAFTLADNDGLGRPLSF